MPNKLKQIGSILATFFLYQFLVGWRLALTLVVGIVWHEMSHILAAKKMKLGTNGMILIPFIGGVSFIDGPYKSSAQQAFVVLAGPVGGAVSAFIIYGVYLLTGTSFFATASYILCILNLFNLLPLGGVLDGGQLMNSISYSINRKVGFFLQLISTIIAIILIWRINPIMSVFIIFLGVPPLLTEYRNQKNYQDKSWLCTEAYLNLPESMSTRQMLKTGAYWLMTAAALIWLMITLKEFSPF